MSDVCIRATAGDGQVRLWVAKTTDLCEEGRRRHDTYPTATAALGRVLTAAVMMGLNLKGEDILTIRVNGDGPLGGIVATADSLGHVRGYVTDPHVHLPAKSPGKLDVGGAVGKNGLLHVTKDLGLKDPYTGSVPLVSGEIGEDLTRYFAESEQTPSAVSLGVLVETDNRVRAAGGFIVQMMPGASEEAAVSLEENVASLPPVSRMVDEGMSPEDIAGQILQGFKWEVLGQTPLGFRCSCSRERLAWVLKGMGEEELENLSREQEGAELTCCFCGEQYRFSNGDLAGLIHEIRAQIK